MTARFATAFPELCGRNIIVFDGECVLCSSFMRFVLRHDRSARFDFIVAQSDLGERLYRHYGLKSSDYETNLVIIDGTLYQELDAFAEVMARLGGARIPLSWLRYLPGGFKSWLYARIARNRYAIFGQYEECICPSPEIRGRFLD